MTQPRLQTAHSALTQPSMSPMSDNRQQRHSDWGECRYPWMDGRNSDISLLLFCACHPSTCLCRPDTLLLVLFSCRVNRIFRIPPHRGAPTARPLLPRLTSSPLLLADSSPEIGFSDQPLPGHVPGPPRPQPLDRPREAPTYSRRAREARLDPCAWSADHVRTESYGSRKERIACTQLPLLASRFFRPFYISRRRERVERRCHSVPLAPCGRCQQLRRWE